MKLIDIICLKEILLSNFNTNDIANDILKCMEYLFTIINFSQSKPQDIYYELLSLFTPIYIHANINKSDELKKLMQALDIILEYENNGTSPNISVLAFIDNIWTYLTQDFIIFLMDSKFYIKLSNWIILNLTEIMEDFNENNVSLYNPLNNNSNLIIIYQSRLNIILSLIYKCFNCNKTLFLNLFEKNFKYY